MSVLDGIWAVLDLAVGLPLAVATAALLVVVQRSLRRVGGRPGLTRLRRLTWLCWGLAALAGLTASVLEGGERADALTRAQVVRVVAEGHGLQTLEVVEVSERDDTQRATVLVRRLGLSQRCELSQRRGHVHTLTCAGQRVGIGTETMTKEATELAETTRERLLDDLGAPPLARLLAVLAILLGLACGICCARLRRVLARTATRPTRRSAALTGWKVATPIWHGEDGIGAFQGLTVGSRARFGVLADAVCLRRSEHAPPERDCSCGFHAFRTLQAASALWARSARSGLLVEVALLGRYQLHARGIRAGRQRLTRAVLGDCASCDQPAETLLLSHAAPQHGPGWNLLKPSCADCAGALWAVTPEHFAASLDPTGRFTLTSALTPPPPPPTPQSAAPTPPGT